MNSRVLTNVNDLINEVKGQEVYIYGAKVAAIKVWRRLLSANIRVKSFLVSEKFENPDRLQGLDVIRIEKVHRKLPYVVAAMQNNGVWKLEDELADYSIEKLILLHLALINMMNNDKIISDNCKISKEVMLENNVDIVVDDSSSIEIEPYVFIGSGTKIHAYNNSHIQLKKYAHIAKNSNIDIGDSSLLDIEMKAKLLENVDISCENYSQIYLGEGQYVG